MVQMTTTFLPAITPIITRTLTPIKDDTDSWTGIQEAGKWYRFSSVFSKKRIALCHCVLYDTIFPCNLHNTMGCKTWARISLKDAR